MHFSEDSKPSVVKVTPHFFLSKGCASWDWYYPYHYAPFASDFVDVASAEPDFHKKRTKPFCPLEQLMGVFPAASRSHVPPAWQDLMSDPDSPIIDFYPTDFKVSASPLKTMKITFSLIKQNTVTGKARDYGESGSINADLVFCCLVACWIGFALLTAINTNAIFF